MSRTPRRTATKKTPYKARAVKSVPQEDTPKEQEKVLDLIKYYKEKEKAREEYVKALKEENSYLRSTISVQDTRVPSINWYSSLLGLKIEKIGEEFHCAHSIEKEQSTSSIEFILSYDNGVYTYRHKSSTIEELPEYLKEEIYFEEDQVKLFFFNIYECVAKRE
ncbi:hypothetical protein NEFER03_1732 [Nematocida sp. LUAm3]|nr:hypothetical protein NEFER03_1732 [Nematocida sp. LUAm3]KAI5175722.1 hypothetical protein NEFER02_1609 [Nematocida sp. LUAm2]KAI5178628.1 hypothetical protein NEFER01_1764 [Nematocida sp. LUAm1]